MTDADPLGSPLVWDADGGPRSRRFGDIYFSKENGLGEARLVFLEGCDLPKAWRERTRSTVAELGLGAGVNVAALLDLWERCGPPHAHLHILSVESDPISRDDARRALGAWPEIASAAEALIERWPGRARGFHRLDFPERRAIIDVAVMDVGSALADWDGTADAWFLDGFSPALNPEMWSPSVLSAVARRSNPGARAATYTVAGSVRRGLADAGFALRRAPGFGRKRERLEASLPGAAVDPPAPSVAIVGAGIAGASLCRAFRALGVEPMLFDAVGAGAGASGAPAALAAPRLDAGLGPGAALFAQASRRARDLYRTTAKAVVGSGALQIAMSPKDDARFSTIAGSDLFEPGAMSLHPQPGGRNGLSMKDAVTVNPKTVIAAWTPTVMVASIHDLAFESGRWRLLDELGTAVAEVDCVCLANGLDASRLSPGLELTAVRGQATVAEGLVRSEALVFGGYAIPTRDGVMIGATHERGDTSTEPRPEEQARNLAGLASVDPDLAGQIDPSRLWDWCGVRATTSDYLPLAGEATDSPAGLWVLSGLGSRGFCLAPLLAEHIAARALGCPSPLPNSLAALVDPGRFAARARRRGRPERSKSE